ncbi:M15 family metallopeptidase [Pseudalkalibacillus sp. SCS-8]|uniref:M15 family metallopeptidase n=1 Tax=Pseudalkalibacillus nanhaiensis TaxID=3115291 RepID=UPI0032DA1A70
MKRRTTVISIMTTIVLLGGCASIPNPFAEEADPTEKETPVEENQGGEVQDPNEDQDEGKENPEEETETDTGLPDPEETVTVTADGKKVITNVNDPLVLVNKERNLPADFVPEDLVIPNVPFPFTEDLPKKQLQKVAADAAEALFDQAEKDGIPLFAQSGYRSYDRQEAIFTANAERVGEEEANKFSAFPGQSEHQSGLALDVTSPEVEFKLVEQFGETEAGRWVKANAHKYGFIIRYPKGKETITGYQYEPWHLRYVGKEHAKRIHEQNMTLEEYLGVEVEPVNSSQ